MQIWKYPIEATGEQILEVPKGAIFLTVQTQRGTPQIWALCEPDEPKERRMIAMYGTGHLIPSNPGKYIGTFQIGDGKLVFHIFEPELEVTP